MGEPFRVLSSAPALILFLAVSAGIASGSDLPGADIPQGADGQKTMTRTADAMVLPGADFKGVLHREICTLSLAAYVDGAFQPIPFQIDERNEQGEWVLPLLTPAAKGGGRHPQEDSDRGLLDENDQVVFMVRDAGNRAPAHAVPPKALDVDEIQLLDPVDGGLAWVYLCAYADEPPLSDKDYVSYDAPGESLMTHTFRLRFSKKLPISWAHLGFLGQPNMLDSHKIRIHLNFMGISFKRNETDFKANLVAYKDGAVRVIRRVESSFKLTPFLVAPSTTSETLYYDNAILIPVRIWMPMDLKGIRPLVGWIRARGSLDMTGLENWVLRSDIDPRLLTVDGQMDELEQAMQGQPARWFMLSGPPGGLFCRMILDRKPDGTTQTTSLSTRLFYVDDAHTPDPPEFVPSQLPNVGFTLDGVEHLPKGNSYFQLSLHMIKDFKPGQEEEIARVVDAPVAVSVHRRL